MSLKTQIEQRIKDAMKSRNADELRALRAIKSAILIAETEKGAEGTLSAEAELRLLTKAVKQRKDSAEIYISKGRKDLADKERSEIEVINRYLPKPLTAEEIKQELKALITLNGFSGMGDMGKLMGLATKKLAGKADGKAISEAAKSLLN